MAIDCQQVHAALRRQEGESPELSEHLAQCPACRSVVEAGPMFARALDAEPESPPVDALWEQMEQSLDRERGPVAWLRSRPTPVRALLAVLGAAVVPLLVLLLWSRVDLEVYPASRWWMDLVVLVVPLCVALAVVMRPVHRPSWPRWVGPTVVVLAMAAVLVGPAMVPAHHGHAMSLGGTGDALLPAAAVCLVIGSILGLPMIAWMLVLLRRGGRRPMPLAAIAAGIVGVLSIFLHCPIVASEHLLCGHATILIPFLALALLGRR